MNEAGNSKIVVDFLKNRWVCDCLGCAISNGKVKIPGGVIHEGNYTLLGADPEVPIPGFLVITLKRHVNSFSELNKEERIEVVDIIAYAEKALKELNITQEVTIVQEERAKHMHIWIFPNYNWMTEKFGKGITYFRAISKYAQENVNNNIINETLNTAEKIRKYFKEKY